MLREAKRSPEELLTGFCADSSEPRAELQGTASERPWPSAGPARDLWQPVALDPVYPDPLLRAKALDPVYPDLLLRAWARPLLSSVFQSMTWTCSSCMALACPDLGMKLELGLRPVCCQAREGSSWPGCEAQGTPSCSLAWCPSSWRRAPTGAIRGHAWESENPGRSW